jgi:branched-subunit amino acid aminotransferase/4-amino-4-deoxychorismate lyase
MPFLFRDGNLSEISSVTEYLLDKSSSLYTTMRFSSKFGKIFELEMHLQRVKASELESEEIKEMLKRLPMTTDLRITLIRSSIGFEFVYEEMPILKISSCQVEIRQAKRENVQEKNSQWVK